MKARILVIEDEMAINDLLCMNLEAAGYETVSPEKTGPWGIWCLEIVGGDLSTGCF